MAALALVIILLLTAVAQAVFGDIGYFRDEFEKYIMSPKTLIWKWTT